MEPVSASISTALAGLRLAREMAKNLKQTDIHEKLQEVYDLVGDMRHQMFELEDENRRLLREVEKLKSEEDLKKDVVFEGGLYWRKTESGRDGPFCPYCLDADGKLVHTEHMGSNRHYCNLHNRGFYLRPAG